MIAAMSDIGALLAGVVGLYGLLHPALRVLIGVSFMGWLVVYPLARLLRGALGGFS